MIQSKDLEKQLLKLGFADITEMLQSAMEQDNNPTEDPKIGNTHALYHSFNELNLDASCFVIVGEITPNQWSIHSIKTSVQFESDKTIERVGFLQKAYFQKDGPLPNVEKLKKEIVEHFRIHDIKARMAKRKSAKLNKGKKFGL